MLTAKHCCFPARQARSTPNRSPHLPWRDESWTFAVIAQLVARDTLTIVVHYHGVSI